MTTIDILWIDIAKNVFQLNGLRRAVGPGRLSLEIIADEVPAMIATVHLAEGDIDFKRAVIIECEKFPEWLADIVIRAPGAFITGITAFRFDTIVSQIRVAAARGGIALNPAFWGEHRG